MVKYTPPVSLHVTALNEEWASPGLDPGEGQQLRVCPQVSKTSTTGHLLPDAVGPAINLKRNFGIVGAGTLLPVNARQSFERFAADA